MLICSISCCSDRSENKIWIRLAGISLSGGTEGTGDVGVERLEPTNEAEQSFVGQMPDLA